MPAPQGSDPPGPVARFPRRRSDDPRLAQDRRRPGVRKVGQEDWLKLVVVVQGVQMHDRQLLQGAELVGQHSLARSAAPNDHDVLTSAPYGTALPGAVMRTRRARALGRLDREGRGCTCACGCSPRELLGRSRRSTGSDRWWEGTRGGLSAVTQRPPCRSGGAWVMPREPSQL